MKLQLVILPRAERDIETIFNLIFEQNVEGEFRWLEAFKVASAKTVDFPESYSLAPEHGFCDDEIWQFFFPEKRGNLYRGRKNEKQLNVLLDTLVPAQATHPNRVLRNTRNPC